MGNSQGKPKTEEQKCTEEVNSPRLSLKGIFCRSRSSNYGIEDVSNTSPRVQSRRESAEDISEIIIGPSENRSEIIADPSSLKSQIGAEFDQFGKERTSIEFNDTGNNESLTSEKNELRNAPSKYEGVVDTCAIQIDPAEEGTAAKFYYPKHQRKTDFSLESSEEYEIIRSFGEQVLPPQRHRVKDDKNATYEDLNCVLYIREFLKVRCKFGNAVWSF